jgi:anhydro-N-acetylmuramic acid kinase
MNVIGLISGTSVDGIDAAVVEIGGSGYEIRVTLQTGNTHPYPAELRAEILAVCAGQPRSMADLATLDDAIATQFATAAQALLAQHPDVVLIASHGQTVYHRPPNGNLGYSLQLGRGPVIAQQTGLPTISNFRAADIALGGQGAPLVSPVDACLLSHPSRVRCVQNLGGIGNVTYLPAWDRQGAFPDSIQGWDTGPGNALLDWAVSTFTQGQQTYDAGGAWAAQGTVHQSLVEGWLAQPFFHQAPPKSTGRELFGADYGQRCWQAAQALGLSQADFLASLTELTAASIALGYRRFLPQLPQELILCGGGSHNAYLQQRLRSHLPAVSLLTTDQLGLNADYKEAIAFAVLGFWRWHDIPANLPAVTGSRHACLLGDMHSSPADESRP